MNGAVGALGQRFADGLAGALRTGAQGDDLSTVLFLKLQPGLQCVGIGLIDFVSQVGFFDPLALGGDAQLRIARRNLLDGDDDFHRNVPSEAVKESWPLINTDEHRSKTKVLSVFICVYQWLEMVSSPTQNTA